MPIRDTNRRLPLALALTSGMWLATAAETRALETPPSDLSSEVSTVKAENALLREHLQRIADHQRALMEVVRQVQRLLDGEPLAEAARPAQPRTADLPEPLAQDAKPEPA